MWLPLTCRLLGNWPPTQVCALIENRTSNLLVYRLALNPLSHTSQGSLSSLSMEKGFLFVCVVTWFSLVFTILNFGEFITVIFRIPFILDLSYWVLMFTVNRTILVRALNRRYCVLKACDRIQIISCYPLLLGFAKLYW